jgi:uncharacterized membrane protein YfcA
MLESLLPPLDPWMIALAVAAVLLGSFVKGTTGLGLPLTAVPVMANFLPVPTSMALLFAPVLMSNLWQSFHPQHTRPMIRRFWPLAFASVFGILIGAKGLATLEPRVLHGLMGTLVLIFASLNFFSPHFTLKPGKEPWLGPLVGFGSGILGGVSSFFGPPMALYLMALGLKKNEFVTAISLVFLVATLVLNLAMLGYQVVGWRELALSLAMLLPTFLGMSLGRRIREKVNATLFNRLVLALLIVSSANLLRKAIFF